MIVLLADMTMGERLAYSGRMLLIGIATVFLALTVLWGSLALFRFVMEKTTAKKNKKTAPTQTAAPIVLVTETPDNGALVAAITAAVAATLAAENGGVTPAFRVVSYRRAGR